MTLTLITGCGERFQKRIAPDPKLQEQENSSNSTNSTSNTQAEESDSSNSSQTDQTNSVLELPDQVPEKIPFYPNSELVNQDINSEQSSGTIELTSVDGKKRIKTFYEEKLTQGNWKIIAPFSETSEGKEKLTAQSTLPTSSDQSRSGNSQRQSRPFKLTVFISEIAENRENTSNIVLQYQPLSKTNQDKKRTKKQQPETTSTTQFSDLEKTPDALETYVRDVVKLGILTPTKNQKFAPNEVITRRTFARWLFKANNRFYQDNPSQKIRPVQHVETSAFQDIPPSDPDFPIIQGLAEAGIVPSQLSGDTTNAQFRPDAPLTRETLLLWKVPLDIRGNLPSVDVTNVRKRWGFQDANKIDGKALGAVVADYSDGEQSNFRRIYGYTQLFQPDKPVTRAEAATALWLFGNQGEAVSAKQLINNN